MTDSTKPTRETLGSTLKQMIQYSPECDCPTLDPCCVYCHARVKVFALKDEGVI